MSQETLTNQTTCILDKETCCDRCGGLLTDGYEIRTHNGGSRCSETGDLDQELVCSNCTEKESLQRMQDADDEHDAWSDDLVTNSLEEVDF